MPFVDVLVPVDLHGLDPLARERLRCSLDSRMMLRVPGREERHPLRPGGAIEIGDLGKAGRRRLLEQAVKPQSNAFASDIEARPGRGRDRDCLKAINASDQLSPVGELALHALARST